MNFPTSKNVQSIFICVATIVQHGWQNCEWLYSEVKIPGPPAKARSIMTKWCCGGATSKLG
jgi:hypothetical protein